VCLLEYIYRLAFEAMRLCNVKTLAFHKINLHQAVISYYSAEFKLTLFVQPNLTRAWMLHFCESQGILSEI